MNRLSTSSRAAHRQIHLEAAERALDLSRPQAGRKVRPGPGPGRAGFENQGRGRSQAGAGPARPRPKAGGRRPVYSSGWLFPFGSHLATPLGPDLIEGPRLELQPGAPCNLNPPLPILLFTIRVSTDGDFTPFWGFLGCEIAEGDFLNLLLK